MLPTPKTGRSGKGSWAEVPGPRAPRPCPISHAIADISDGSWEEVEEEEDDLEEEEDDDDDDEDMFLEETPIKQVKRLAPQKQTSAGKVREGCPRAPQKPGQRLQAPPAKCSARLLWPWPRPDSP